MTVAEILIRKLDFAAKSVEMLKVASKMPKAAFVRDATQVAAAERCLQVCVESLLDACELGLQLKALRIGAYAKETIKRAVEAQLLESDEGGQLEQFIQLRNRLVHDYELVPPGKIYQNLNPAVALFSELAPRFVKLAAQRP